MLISLSFILIDQAQNFLNAFHTLAANVHIKANTILHCKTNVPHLTVCRSYNTNSLLFDSCLVFFVPFFAGFFFFPLHFAATAADLRVLVGYTAAAAPADDETSAASTGSELLADWLTTLKPAIAVAIPSTAASLVTCVNPPACISAPSATSPAVLVAAAVSLLP